MFQSQILRWFMMNTTGKWHVSITTQLILSIENQYKFSYICVVVVVVLLQLNTEWMECLGELSAFVSDIRTQKPNGGMLKVYLLGCVLDVLGSVFGLLELVCQPFTSELEPVPGHWEEKLILTELGSEVSLRNSVKRLQASWSSCFIRIIHTTFIQLVINCISIIIHKIIN